MNKGPKHEKTGKRIRPINGMRNLGGLKSGRVEGPMKGACAPSGKVSSRVIGATHSGLNVRAINEEVRGGGRRAEPAKHRGHLAAVVRRVVGDMNQEVPEPVRGGLATQQGEGARRLQI
jgi:hypothetical protein